MEMCTLPKGFGVVLNHTRNSHHRRLNDRASWKTTLASFCGMMLYGSESVSIGLTALLMEEVHGDLEHIDLPISIFPQILARRHSYVGTTFPGIDNQNYGVRIFGLQPANEKFGMLHSTENPSSSESAFYLC